MAPVDKQAQVVLKQTQIVAATIMGLNDVDDVDPNRPLTDLGLDSLMAVEFVNALSAVIGAPVVSRPSGLVTPSSSSSTIS